LENYGVQTVDGIIVEGDSNHYISNYPYYLVPNIESHDITDEMISNSSYVLMPEAQGIQILDSYRDTITITSLLTTSDSAYSKVDIANMQTYEKEAGDIDGPFNLAAAITETVDDIETKIVYTTAQSLFDESMDEAVSGGNSEFIISALSWMAEHEVTISIPSKSLETEYLTLTSASVNFWSLFTIFVLPAGILLCGGLIWFRRRKL